MENFFGNMIIDAVTELTEKIWDSFFGYIESFYTDTDWITGHSYTDAACAVTTATASAFLVLLACKHIFTTYILETDGDPDMDPLQYLVKVSLAMALIQMQNFVFRYLLRLSGLLCDAITGSVTAPGTGGFDGILGGAVRSGLAGPVASILAVVFVIVILILIFKAALRAVELAMMKIMYPLFCCDLVTPGRERWGHFTEAYAACIFGYIIQVMCLRMGMGMYFGTNSMSGLVGSMALMFFALKTPKWLEKFTYTSGAGQTVSGAGRTGLFAAMQFARFK